MTMVTILEALLLLLESLPDGTFSVQGVIERRTDVDFFNFMSEGGVISINVNPAQLSPNLDILTELYDSSGTLVAEHQIRLTALPASISETTSVCRRILYYG